MFDGAFGLAGNIHLAFVQALAQIVRRQVNQYDFIGRIKKRIGDGFPHLDTGYAAHHVVQAFQMLNIHRGEDVNACLKQLLNILPALRMAGAWRIAVRQFVHQDQGRAAGKGGIKIKLRDQPPAMADTLGRLRRQPRQQRSRLFATVGFHHADENIKPLRPKPLGFRQHGEGFPDTRAGAEKNFQLATVGFSRLFKQPVRIRAHGLVGHLVLP